MRRYIFNSAVITTPGTYRYQLIDLETAKRWLSSNSPIISTIGYQETADALFILTGYRATVKKVQTSMQVGGQLPRPKGRSLWEQAGLTRESGIQPATFATGR